ncbi:MAG: hypothetical protein FJ135_02315 [Deltaproteobacteria bacterium]|nr:hypothetical protein [Deltaproteobacteria bacterium]
MLGLSSCVMLSNREYYQEKAATQGIVRVGVVLQRWPHFLAGPDQNSLSSDFIQDRTRFLGPWKPSDNINPRAVDVLDLTDVDVARTFMEVMQKRGYEPFLMTAIPGIEPDNTVAHLLENFQSSPLAADGFLFCYYAPMLFVADPAMLPADARNRSLSLWEVSYALQPGTPKFTWSGQRMAKAPAHTITHAFIYVSLTLFDARNLRPVWMVADARVGGRIRPRVAECPPGPTDLDYWTDPDMTVRLMLRNLRCRLWHLFPDAFP